MIDDPCAVLNGQQRLGFTPDYFKFKLEYTSSTPNRFSCFEGPSSIIAIESPK